MHFFLSTLSLRRATEGASARIRPVIYFYPRSPYGERLRIVSVCSDNTSDISIHALLTESDESTTGILRFYPIISIHALLTESDHAPNQRLCQHNRNFYPRSPYGERHFTGSAWVPEFTISIHALLTESDSIGTLRTVRVKNFYPRSPYGERRVKFKLNLVNQEFLSTLSLRRATGFSRPLRAAKNYFYPRSPYGERQTKQACRAKL